MSAETSTAPSAWRTFLRWLLDFLLQLLHALARDTPPFTARTTTTTRKQRPRSRWWMLHAALTRAHWPFAVRPFGAPFADLAGTNLRGIHVNDAKLAWVDLNGALLIGARLENADLRQARLTSANLRRAHLNGANLNGARLVGADMSVALLVEAHLEGTDLQSSSLDYTSLRGAHMAGAKLDGARLVGADLSDADLTGTDLRISHSPYLHMTKTLWSTSTRWPSDQFESAIRKESNPLDSKGIYWQVR
ncbi:pentapeptide repeat-containing protein [Streptomonospora salina]|uniref:Pentapeptide repeat-containing protein n=2 Tax=Streptomonospora salina TaxID=104205 RepID=A0A841EAM0_9ACTN|nr:hypothetical protein [Streptomonospora salina]